MKSMRLFGIVLLATFLSGGSNKAYADACGENLTWTYDKDTKTLTISGTGEMDNYNTSSNSPWYDIRDNIQTIVIKSGVTSIGSSAFKGCKEVNSVEIPNSVIKIGESAFQNCKGITSFTINDKVSTIEPSTFYGCSNLATLIIGKSVTSIGHNNFVFCGLKDIYCYAEAVPFASKAFEGADVDGHPEVITLHVPANSIKDYQAEYPWKNFKEIVALEDTGICSVESDNEIIETYSLRGEKLNNLSKGIKIIRTKDGQTKKVFFK